MIRHLAHPGPLDAISFRGFIKYLVFSAGKRAYPVNTSIMMDAKHIAEAFPLSGLKQELDAL